MLKTREVICISCAFIILGVAVYTFVQYPELVQGVSVLSAGSIATLYIYNAYMISCENDKDELAPCKLGK